MGLRETQMPHVEINCVVEASQKVVLGLNYFICEMGLQK